MFNPLLLLPALALSALEPKPLDVRVGYFLGGRTSLVMRSSEFGDFAKEGLNVTLLTKRLRENDWAPIDRVAVEKDRHDVESKATGVELVEGMLAGRWELATIGESSYVAAAAAGKPIVAVAQLGHDVRGESGHLFALRKGLAPKRPEDYNGLLLVSRRAGPGDRAMLREYLLRRGVNLSSDTVTIVEPPADMLERARLPKDKVVLDHEVDDDVMRALVREGIADGGFFHLKPYEGLSRWLYAVDPLEAWMNPEVSQAILVCTREYARSEAGREAIRRFLRATIQRNARERALKPWERLKEHNRWLSLVSRTPGYNYPQYDDVPTIKFYLLEETFDLLHRHRLITSGPIDWREYVDNSLVLEVAAGLEPGPSWR